MVPIRMAGMKKKLISNVKVFATQYEHNTLQEST